MSDLRYVPSYLSISSLSLIFTLYNVNNKYK